MPRAVAQSNMQLSLTLIGQDTGQYVTPAGQTTTLKMEILNIAKPKLYLLQGEAYLDPDLSGMWELVHSEQLGSFLLGYLQSAIWTFDLTVPANIQAANVTGGTPLVNLLIKITYQAVGGTRDVEQKEFRLIVPGATVQGHMNLNVYALASLLILVPIGIVYLVTKRRLKRVVIRRCL